MSVRNVGMVGDLSAANATAFNRVEINPTTVIQVTEFGISMNGAPNSVLAPVEFNVQRMSTVGTGTAGTVVPLNSNFTTALVSTALVENSADGTLSATLHRLYVPVVSGVIWVAAPGREFDCLAAQFLGIKNMGALGASINADVYVVFEE